MESQLIIRVWIYFCTLIYPVIYPSPLVLLTPHSLHYCSFTFNYLFLNLGRVSSSALFTFWECFGYSFFFFSLLNYINFLVNFLVSTKKSWWGFELHWISCGENWPLNHIFQSMDMEFLSIHLDLLRFLSSVLCTFQHPYIAHIFVRFPRISYFFLQL